MPEPSGILGPLSGGAGAPSSDRRSPPVKRTGIYSVCHSDSELCGCAVLGTVEIWLILRCSSNSTKCALCSAGRESCSAPIPSSRQPISRPTPIPPRLGFFRLLAHFNGVSNGLIRVVAGA